MRFALSTSNHFHSFKFILDVILSMTLLNFIATLANTRISSRAKVSTAHPRGGVAWISKRQRGTGISVSNGYPYGSLPMLSGYSICAIFTYSPRSFPHRIYSSTPTISSSVSNLHILAATSEVHVMGQPISLATTAPGISESQTHLRRMNYNVQTWRARNLVPGGSGIEYWFFVIC